MTSTSATTPDGDRPARVDAGRGWTYVVDLAMLVALCVPAYFFGLNNFGPSNWQESQRAIVVQEMRESRSLLVPTFNGKPYLAKPPLIYWTTVGVAKLRGEYPGLRELRFVVGLAGLLGVCATYVVARRLFESDGDSHAPTRRVMDNSVWARWAALWSGVMLAGGVLYFRSSRIGELDILLVPSVVGAIGAIAHAWRVRRSESRTAWGALLLAAIAGGAAGLTKGPPALLIVALGGYGGILLIRACEDLSGDGGPRPISRWVVAGGALISVAAGGFAFFRRDADTGVLVAGIGSILIVLLVGMLLAVLVRAFGPVAREAAWATFRGTHPILVLAGAAAPLLVWAWMVRQRIGSTAESLGGDEAEGNLRLLVATSPINNLEACAYGVGLGSLAAMAAVVWYVKDRPRIRPAWCFIIAWAGLTLIAMSLLGKGVGRYLTPAWPAVAMLGGMFVATLVADAKRPRVTGTAVACIAVVLIGVQAWWYGMGREIYQAEQTPRRLIAELRSRHGMDSSRLTTLNFHSPAVDYEVGRWVQPVGDIGSRSSIADGVTWTVAEFAADVSAHGPRTLLVKQSRAVAGAVKDPLDEVWAAGLRVEPIATESVFLISGYKTPVVAVRVNAP